MVGSKFERGLFSETLSFKKNRDVSIVRKFSFLFFVFVISCSSSKDNSNDFPYKPHHEGSAKIPSGELSLDTDSTTGKIALANGEFIQTKVFAGQSFVPVEGMIDQKDFQNILSAARMVSSSDEEVYLNVNQSLELSLNDLETKVRLVETKTYSRIGFFTSYILAEDYQNLSKITDLPYQLVLNPVVSKNSKNMIKKMDQKLLGSMFRSGFKTDGFSGLKVIGEPKFRKMVQKEVGVVPDGSTVTVGVVDTGLTLNHPSFKNKEGKSRVSYLKDFTNEGRVYINPSAKFEVSENNEVENSEEALDFEAEVLRGAPNSFSTPIADSFVSVEGTMLVSKKLRKKLLQEGSGAKLGILRESAWNAPGETVDFNLNGKTNDVFYFLVVPEGDKLKAYIAFSGRPDFRKSPALSNWNDSFDSMQVISEKVGVDFGTQKLLDKKKDQVDILTISLVGFDPGNHGSHVSGIIAGRKTLQNDDEQTLARGVAPNSSIMMGRVCANNGGCQATSAIVDLALNGANIINMSLGGLSPFNDGYSVQEAVINRLTEIQNVLFVISAGNSGPAMNTTGSPSNARHAISVGASANPEMIQAQYKWPAKGLAKVGKDFDSLKGENNDFILFFSSRGPNGVGGFKPNITAPGTELSAVQLNGANGMRSGLDVYWGTSMSAPTASGAIALLLDAVYRFNRQSTSLKLPTDALTLRKIIIDSAVPFDVTRFDTSSQKFERGQYSWIDQGNGMLNLPRAWKLLKKYAQNRLSSPVSYVKEDVTVNVPLDYQVRVLDSYRNGGIYNGSELSSKNPMLAELKFGRGLWLNAKDDRSLFQVHIARRLPITAMMIEEYGDLRTQLLTTMDEFTFKTVVYGSNTKWLKVGVRDQYDCHNSPEIPYVVVGQGAVDKVGSDAAGSTVGRESALNICINRQLTENLTAGDHGALVFAYRTVNGKKSQIPAFVVPVYLTVPHKVLSGRAAYVVDDKVSSMGVSRNYINVPVGTNLVKVSLEVPEAIKADGLVSNCSEVRLYANEASNTTSPPEISGPNASKAIVKNCTKEAAPSVSSRVLQFSRVNPNSGVWDLHVFGRYAAEISDYKLQVDFAKINVSKKRIAGDSSLLSGSFNFEVLESSINAEPNAEFSSFDINQLIQSVVTNVDQGATVVVPRKDGEQARTYSKDVASVEIITGGSTGNDIDLVVLECSDAELEKCRAIGQSGTATDEEKVVFIPKAKKFYAASVAGYEISVNEGEFILAEVQNLKKSEKGLLSIESMAKDSYKVEHVFDVEASDLFKLEEHLSGDFDIGGAIRIKSADKDALAEVPVRIRAEKDD